MNDRTKKLTTLAMLTALSYLIVATIRIPVVMFLKYEPKDVIITIGGFIFGPVEGFLIALVVSLIEMASVSDTGVIGAIMNLVSTSAFVLPAAIIYRKNRTLKGAIIGLVTAVFVMVAVMLLWNYLLTPIYMGYPREAVAELLLPVFLPFNLLKGGLNATITMLLYKPVVTGLRKAHLVPAERHVTIREATAMAEDTNTEPIDGGHGIGIDPEAGSFELGDTSITGGSESGDTPITGGHEIGTDPTKKDHKKVSGLVVLVSSLLLVTFVLLTLVLAGKI